MLDAPARMFDRAARQASLLQELPIAVSEAPDPRAAARAIVTIGRELLDAVSGVLWLVDDDGALSLVASAGIPDEFLARWKTIGPSADLPAIHAVRAGHPLWVGSMDDYRRVVPNVADDAERANRPLAFAAVPLAFEARTLGVVIFGFAAPHAFSDEKKKLILAVAGHAAQALERARLERAQARALTNLRMVARAGEMLSTSLDLDATLTALAKAVVPDIADWCAVDMLVDGEIRRLTAQHVDPTKLELARAYVERYPTRVGDGSSTARILETGETVWARRITPEMLRASSIDDEQAQILLDLGLRSTVQVPLSSEGRTCGVVSFIMAESGREYDETDRDVLVEIGRRASLAITNASLYAREQRARERVTRLLENERKARERVALLAAAGESFSTTIEYDETLERMVRVVLPSLADFAFFDVVEGERVRRVSGAHDDPEIAALLARSEWVRSERTDVNLCALSTGASAIHPRIDDAFRRNMAADEGHLAVLEKLQLCSMITVPVVSRGAVIGALTLCYGRSGRHHTNDDLELALELARRGAIAVEQARLYRRSVDAARRAEEANRVKDEFLATVSHELRTPLNAIVGWAHLLAGDKLTDLPFVVRGMEVIRRQATAQRELIDDILDVSRIITGKLRIDAFPVDVSKVARDAMDVVRPGADAKGVRLEAGRVDAPARVIGDRARLQQVVWNLLANGVKFTPAGGTVTVDVIEDAAHVTVRVRDTGIGIEAAFLPHVFERFEQADSSSTRSHGGLGLGLSIVRHLVELHGGTVSAASEGRGRGATFEVVLPLQPDAALGATLQTSRRPRFAAPPSLAEKKVLVVDDDEDSRELVGEILSTAGAVVSLAESAAAAVSLFTSHGFDVVVTDIAMPGADGYALLAELARVAEQRSVGLRAVALTAYGRAEDRAAAERAGFRAHVSKPVEPGQLIDTVARVLDRA